MTTELDKLIEAIEAENDPPWGADIPWGSFAQGLGMGPGENVAPSMDPTFWTKRGPADCANWAYRGSLDAAKALHEALLPGWVWTVSHRYGAVMDHDGSDDLRDLKHFSVNAEPPARAWLLAILRAYRATLSAQPNHERSNSPDAQDDSHAKSHPGDGP